MGSCLMEESICLSRYWRLKLCSFTWEVWLISLIFFTSCNSRYRCCWVHLGRFSPSVVSRTVRCLMSYMRVSLSCIHVRAEVHPGTKCLPEPWEIVDLWSFCKHISVNIKETLWVYPDAKQRRGYTVWTHKSDPSQKNRTECFQRNVWLIMLGCRWKWALMKALLKGV